MARSRERLIRRSPAMLAGWLFADLLLMLFLVSFASQAARPTASPTSSPTPTPTRSTNPPTAISRDFCELLLDVNTNTMAAGDPAEGRRLIARLNLALTGRYPGDVINDPYNQAASRRNCLHELSQHERAGVLIAYGSSPDVSTGDLVGQHAAMAITKNNPRFEGASTLWGWTAQYGSDHIELIVFFASSK